MSKLLLIDGHSLAFRAYHALPAGMDTRSGEPTNATFGFFSMLLNTLREQQPDYVAVAFDVGKTFRHDEFPDYKGHRERMPDDLRQQVERIQEIVQALNIPIFTRDGYEADDVLGTLAKQAEAQGVETMIVTGDRDIVQVVSDRTSVLTSGRRFSDTIVYTPETVQERWGLAPKKLIDLKALLGDTSDNVPGVKGVGEKGATDLIQTYGSLEAVYDNLDQITAKRTRTALEAGRDSAFLSKHLVTIITDSVSVHPSWTNDPSDFFCVADTETHQVLIERGIAAEKIAVTGFPVSPRFAMAPPPTATPSASPSLLYLPSTPVRHVAATLNALRPQVLAGVKLTLPAGKHLSRLYHVINAFADSVPADRFELIGWTDRMPDLLRSHDLVICKAGGAILHEVLAARTPAVIDYVVPGQEEGNAEMLLSHGCGLRSTTPQQTAEAVAQLFADQGRLLKTMRSQMVPPLSLPDAACQTARAVLNCAR
jgi:5'-3' exonuclease